MKAQDCACNWPVMTSRLLFHGCFLCSLCYGFGQNFAVGGCTFGLAKTILADESY